VNVQVPFLLNKTSTWSRCFTKQSQVLIIEYGKILVLFKAFMLTFIFISYTIIIEVKTSFEAFVRSAWLNKN